MLQTLPMAVCVAHMPWRQGVSPGVAVDVDIDLNRKLDVRNESETKQLQQKGHLQKLRDLLDLPFNTLKGDELVFQMADERHVIASCTESGHLSLICEIGKPESLSAAAWQSLLARVSSVHDYAFPASLITVDGKLALLWGCDAGIDPDEWIRRAEDALTLALDLHTRIGTNTL
jgi:hypothetical protein